MTVPGSNDTRQDAAETETGPVEATDAPGTPDPLGECDSIERRVFVTAARPGATGPNVAVRLTHRFPVQVTELWDALTRADRLAQWFAPVSGELRLGGHFQVEGNAGGSIETCTPLEGFAVTWEFGDGASIVTVGIAESEGGTRLTLEHDGEVPEDFWREFGPGATGVGWDLAFFGLRQHLTTGADAPPETTEWATSDEGLAFVAASSGRWADASIAAGTEPSDARAARDRTTAFYVGEAE
ncbi:ATPase [Pseudoclavibacter endophyticus]|uniref:Polyketide cyclase n=1 Tax=Pseudoclavibacter endophyticus TaxID=1778590 RepID=A0A6H9WGG9_9MICO|nr:SRPBCC domain-containing protein [Pseudoclavibacter endophyticus]KAB1646691.1 polyketide cyclase [Pseudoclavibacter endophyticus]GGA76415.1 ATPase [Pseudoclavibacter endophyticus]